MWETSRRPAAVATQGLAIRQVMRSNQSKRMRGRNRKSQNPLSRVYESNGPDVKIRGSASHIAEKYIQLARDAQSSGDPVGAENYYQHAEHYFRLIAAAQDQYRQSQPFYRSEGEARGEDTYDDEDEGAAAMGGEPSFVPREAQPYPTREPQPYPARESQPQFSRGQQQPGDEDQNDGERLPSFITGNGQPQQHQANGQNGFEGGHQADRFPLHRRRRRHRGSNAAREDQSSTQPSGE